MVGSKRIFCSSKLFRITRQMYYRHIKYVKFYIELTQNLKIYFWPIFHGNNMYFARGIDV